MRYTMKKTLIMITSLLLLGIVAVGTSNLIVSNIYVSSSSGKDTNTGIDPSVPIKTLAKLSTMQLGQGYKVYFKCGDTWKEKWNYQSGSNGIALNPITFDRYGNCTGKNNPIISGGTGIDQQGYTVFFYNRDYVNINNIEFDNAIKNGVNVYMSKNMKFTGCTFKNNYNNAIGITSSSGITVQNSIFDYNGIKMVKEKTGGETIWIAKGSNIVIKGNTITKSGGVPINAWHTDNNLISGNKISGCTAPEGKWEAGIYFDGVTNSVAEYNNVQFCHIGYAVNSEVSGYKSNNIIFRYNIGYNNRVNQVIDSNLGGIVNYNIKVLSNTFVKDLVISNVGGYNNDLIIRGVSNLTFKDNIIADYSTGSLLTSYPSTMNNYAFTYNVWYSASGNYPSIKQTNYRNTNPNFINKVSFKPSGIACTASSTGKYVGAVAC
jgi:parallel beta-helix repeat protein